MQKIKKKMMSKKIEFFYRIIICIFSERIVIYDTTSISYLFLFFSLLFKKYLLDIRIINNKCCESMKGFRE